jgi:integrase
MDNERVVDASPKTELVPAQAGRDRLEDVMRRWLLDKATRSQSRDTVRAYSTTLTRFRAALHRAGLELDSVPAEVRTIAAEWTVGVQVHRGGHRESDSRPASGATRNQRLAILSSFYAFAVAEDEATRVVASNPITRIKRSTVQPYAGAAPLEDRGAVRSALASIDRTQAIGHRDYALLLLALQTGRRRAELAALTWGDVERIGERAIVTFRRCKGGKTMRDELPQRVTEALEAWRAVTPAETSPKSAVWVSLSRNGTAGHALTGQALADLCERHLGTPRVHQLRHTWARTMEEKGAKVSQIQARLGHASLATTGIYLAAVGRGRAENPYAEQLADEWIA